MRLPPSEPKYTETGGRTKDLDLNFMKAAQTVKINGQVNTLSSYRYCQKIGGSIQKAMDRIDKWIPDLKRSVCPRKRAKQLLSYALWLIEQANEILADDDISELAKSLRVETAWVVTETVELPLEQE